MQHHNYYYYYYYYYSSYLLAGWVAGWVAPKALHSHEREKSSIQLKEHNMQQQHDPLNPTLFLTQKRTD
jgi:hypothetical protein